ncbi:MAG TPA: 2-C-methyl-D-erythritol 4-phosphate cytidylyltransferase [Thermoanaerobaculia bacterium]|jgi:2-C-methyl-D-erythritol 4-phosphate cytidylyltransferase
MADSLVVIIPAAGSGSRFGGTIPKQFLQLAGKPLIQHVIERFLLDDLVTRVVVPVAEVLLSGVKNSERVTFLAGGETRMQSVVRGLAEAGDAELVAVHDAVRPLFSAAMFHAVVEAARISGAAAPIVPVSDTIHVMTTDATIERTLDRTMLGAAQTPQCFRGDLLRDVLAQAEREGVEGTDEAGLAARFGHTVRAVPGDPRNLKITVPEDLAVAESYLQQWSRS